MRFEELSYASPDDPWIRRAVIHAIETLSGRPRLLPTYEAWQRIVASEPDWRMTRLLQLRGVRLEIDAPVWPPPLPPGTPLVMIANHPYGIGDGIAALSMAETLRRPFRIFVASQLLKVPEIRDIALPIDFGDTRGALRANLESRRRARAFLEGDRTLVIFPAGAVAIAPRPFARAEERPWKNFTARIVQDARASVLPIYFEGQNSPLYHAAAHVSDTLRTSLLVSEFIRAFRDRALRVRVGDVVPFEALVHVRNGHELTTELHDRVMRLAPAEAQG